MELITDQHITQIKRAIKAKGVKERALVDEMLDHVYCAIEKEMRDSGLSFSLAYAKAMEAFGAGELENIQRESQIAGRKMKKLGLLATTVAACLLLIVVVVQAKERPRNNPFQKGLTVKTKVVEKLDNGNKYIFEVPAGTKVYSTIDAKVLNTERNSNGLITVTILSKKGYRIIYANLEKVSVKKNWEVKDYQLIGELPSAEKQSNFLFEYEIIKE